MQLSRSSYDHIIGLIASVRKTPALYTHTYRRYYRMEKFAVENYCTIAMYRRNNSQIEFLPTLTAWLAGVHAHWIQRNMKTTVAISFCPKRLHFIATFWQRTGRDRRVVAACRGRCCDWPSQHPGRLQSCGYTERDSTLEGGVVASLWYCYCLHFPQTNRILLAHVKQNGYNPPTKEVCVTSARTV